MHDGLERGNGPQAPAPPIAVFRSFSMPIPPNPFSDRAHKSGGWDPRPTQLDAVFDTNRYIGLAARIASSMENSGQVGGNGGGKVQPSSMGVLSINPFAREGCKKLTVVKYTGGFPSRCLP